MRTNFRFVFALFGVCLLISCSDEISMQSIQETSNIEGDEVVAYPKRQTQTRSLSVEQNWEWCLLLFLSTHSH